MSKDLLSDQLPVYNIANGSSLVRIHIVSCHLIHFSFHPYVRLSVCLSVCSSFCSHTVVGLHQIICFRNLTFRYLTYNLHPWWIKYNDIFESISIYYIYLKIELFLNWWFNNYLLWSYLWEEPKIMKSLIKNTSFYPKFIKKIYKYILF